MTKYKNPKIDAELNEEEEIARETALQAEPALTKDEEVWKDRYGNLRRHSAEQESRHKAEKAALEKQLQDVAAGKIKPPKTLEEINAFRAEYPEFSEVLDTWIKTEVGVATGGINQELEKAKQEKALLKLKERHSDALEVLESEEFREWLADQSKAEQDYIYKSYDVKSAAFVIDKFKAATGKSKKSGDSDDKNGAAKAVRVRSDTRVSDGADGKYDYSESQIAREIKSNPGWWDANEDKIMDSQRKNRILMDLSGGAR